MPSRLFDPEYWCQCAEQARAQADQMTNLQARQSLLGIAKGYEHLAERQAKLLHGGWKPNS